jgi:hypothetical protein
MNRFVVKFMKTVIGTGGHETEICQRWFDVTADSTSAAIEIAKQKFCRAEGLPNWTLHADRVAVGEAEFAS